MTESFLPVIVAFCSQKGGVGKSTLARALAVSAARESGVKVRIVDVDDIQETSRIWAKRRAKLGIEPAIPVVAPHRFTDLRRLAEPDDDILIIDAPGRASRSTLAIAKQAHMIVQPTAGSGDDLQPGLLLYNELVGEGIRRERLFWALSRVDSKAEERDTRKFLKEEGWTALDGCLYSQPAYKRAMDAGYSVAETSFKSLNARSALLIDSLNAALKATVFGVYREAATRAPQMTGRAA